MSGSDGTPVDGRSDRFDDVAVSAVVVVHQHAGQGLGDQPISSENVGSILPDPDTVARLQRCFRDLGFEVGAVVAIAFSITASAGRFDAVFPSTAPIGETLSEPTGGDPDRWPQRELQLSIDDLRAAGLGDADLWSSVDQIFVATGADFGPGAP